MKKIILPSLLVVTFIAFSFNSKAQLTATPVFNADSLVSILLGNSSIVVNNATTNCAGLGNNPSGSFTATSTNLGMEEGIILTSGDISEAFGPNTTTSTFTLQGQGDPDLNSLITQTTTDVCILEFDMFIPGDTVKFNYVFGSEEYNFYVNSGFNDVFGFFISGPNPAGGTYTNLNIAQLPTSSTGNFNINLNNVNCGENGQYYVCNDPFNPTLGGCTTECPTTTDSTTVGYNGFTTVLTAFASVVPCNSYHLKIAVADVSDQALDSGVFLEAGSLQSNAVNIELTSLYNDPTGSPAAVEGCSFNPEFVIQLNTYTVVGDSIVNVGAEDTACFAITVSGTAIEGVDYEPLPDTLCFYPGDTIVTLSIDVIDDNISEGIETLVITLTPLDTALSACGTAGDSSVILIYDFPIVVAYPDTTVCAGQPIEVYTNSAPNLTWSPTTDLACPTCMSNDIIATNTITYIATAQIGSCSASDSVTITVIPAPVANAGADVGVCYGDSVQLINTGTGGIACHWEDAINDVSDSCSLMIMPQQSSPYYLFVTGANGCVDIDTIDVGVGFPPQGLDAGTNATVCQNSSTQLFASSFNFGIAFTWTPANTLNDANIFNPVATPLTTTTYTVTASDAGCTATDTVVITVLTLTANAGADTTICLGTDAQLHVTGNNPIDSYNWSPASQLESTNVYNPITNTQTTTTYTVVISDANLCTSSDEVVVTVNPLPNAGAGNDTAICLNESATLNAFGGVNYVWTPTTGLSGGGPTPIASPTVTTTYSVVVSDAIGCSGADEVVVTIYALPVVTASPDFDMCPYETTTISASSIPSSVTYSWAPGDGLSSTDQSSTTAQPSATTTYTVSVVDNNGCTANDQMVLTINPNPALDAQPGFLVYHLNAIEPLTISVNSSYTNYLWTPADGLSDGFTQPVNNTLLTTSSTINANPAESHIYTVVATNSFGCTAIDTVIIEVVDDAILFVPNAFSPDNGDEYNDVFRVRFEGTFALDLFAVYDRWGNQVWSTTKNGLVSGFTDGWDGTINGEPAEIGSYSYVIRGHDPAGTTHAKQGNVTLIR